MTKREHDSLTKLNAGARLASDERDSYRAARGLPLLGSGATARTVARDRIAERAAWRARNPSLPVLATGSRWRAPACFHRYRTTGKGSPFPTFDPRFSPKWSGPQG
jgi:hypothetical protein